MNLWLDDLRVPPTNWVWAKTVTRARTICLLVPVEHASLDHDLGLDPDGNYLENGYEFVKWIAERDRWPTSSLAIHSANHVGVKNMSGFVERYGPYDRKDFIKYAGTEYDAIRYTKTEV